MASTRELLLEREQVIADRENELNRLRAEEAEKEKKGRELEAAQEAMKTAQKKVEDEKAALRAKIAELEVQLEEEKNANRFIVEPDTFLDQTISADPAVVSTTPGTNDNDIEQVFDAIYNPNANTTGTQFLFVPAEMSDYLFSQTENLFLQSFANQSSQSSENQSTSTESSGNSSQS